MTKEKLYFILAMFFGIGYLAGDILDAPLWLLIISFVLQIVFFINWLDAAINMK